MPGRAKGEGPDRIQELIRRMDEAIKNLDALAARRIDEAAKRSDALLESADRKASEKLDQVQAAALEIVRETTRGASGVIREAAGEARRTVRRASDVAWTAVGALSLLAVFAFTLFYIDRAEDRESFQAAGILAFACLALTVAPALLWVGSAGVRAWRNARRALAERERRFDHDLGFVDYLFGFLYVKDRVPGPFGALALFGAALTAATALVLYARALIQ